MRTTTTDHRKCGACMTDAPHTTDVLCHAGHFHANTYSASNCTSRSTHPVAPAGDLWPTRTWGAAL